MEMSALKSLSFLGVDTCEAGGGAGVWGESGVGAVDRLTGDLGTPSTAAK